MGKVNIVVRATSVLVLSWAAGIAVGQTYPGKPVKVVTAAVGGAGDYVARVVAQGISGPLGQPVIVENRGGGAFVPGETVAKAPADGYTLLFAGGSLWLAPYLRDSVPYDPVKDFTPITLLVRSPNLLVVHPRLPVQSVKDLIALARARPGQLNYAATGSGSSGHLAAELFDVMAGVKIVRVSYTSGASMVTDLISGQVQLTFGNSPTVSPHVKSGKLKALAITTPQPSELFPDLPTVAQFLPGYESGTSTGAFAPARTPVAIITKLNQEIARFLGTREAKDRFLSVGTETVGNSPAELAAGMKFEMTKLGKIITDAGIREQ